MKEALGRWRLRFPSERTWPLPLYELALLTAAHVREHGADDAQSRS